LTPRPQRSEERKANITQTCRINSVLELSIYNFYIIVSCRGIYGCFLGRERTDEIPYYFEEPTFIYFQVYVIILMIGNIFYMGYTGKTIHKIFKNKEKMRKDQEKENSVAVWKEEFKVLAQLFTVTGIWWIFDLISGAVSHADYGGTCTSQIVLGLPNLLAGVLIFLATVSKKSVVAGLRDISGLSTMGRSKTEVSQTFNSLQTKETSMASTNM